MSRASIIGMLIAVEILIAGMAIYLIGGTASWGSHRTAFAAGSRSLSFSAHPIASIEAGNAPRIAVDDPDSRIEIVPSTDGRVHVTDLSSVHGAFFSGNVSIAQLQVHRTSDGVAIVRPESSGSGVHFGFGSFDQRVEVDVPAGSRVDITRCSGADVSGVDGGVAVHSQDGRIALTDLQGTVEGRSDDGSITATRVRGDALTLHSADGRLTLDTVTVTSLTARTNDGRIEAHDLAIDGVQPQAVLHSDDGSIRLNGSFAPGGSYEISTKDGPIRLGLHSSSNLTVDASTGDGSLVIDGSSFEGDGDAVHHTVRLGNGAGNLRVSSDDGSIHILTNGAV